MTEEEWLDGLLNLMDYITVIQIKQEKKTNFVKSYTTYNIFVTKNKLQLFY